VLARIFSSITEVDKNGWETVIGKNKLLSYDYLLHIEKTMGREYPCQYICVYRKEEMVAVAPMFTIDIKLDTLMEGGWLKSAARRLNAVFRRAGVITALVVGSPPSSGNFGIGIKEGATGEKEIQVMARAIKDVAKREKIKLIIYKEVPHWFKVDYGQILEKEGCSFGNDMPNNTLKIRWSDNEDFLASMRGKFRQAIKKSERKLVAEGIQVDMVREINSAFGSREYDMYSEVLSKSSNVFEKLTPGYFRQMDTVKSIEPRLLTIKKNKKIIGFFLICDSGEDEISAMFAGIDYRWSRDYDVYFNLFHQTIIHAIKQGKTMISFGQNTYEVKGRIGCKVDRLYIGFCYRNRIVQALLEKFADTLLPETSVKERQVFKQEYI
jgi:predicted N-acyltransferase